MEKGTHKIWFLQLARAVASLSVVYAHWFCLILLPNSNPGMFMQDAIPNYPTVHLIDYVQIMTDYLGVHHFSCGYFALGLFFLLSGYVIPLSLKNSNPYDFLMRRILRIYPTLIICLLITALTMTLVGWYLHSSTLTNIFKPTTLLGNMLLVRDVLRLPRIENAVWTLEIEMHFYLLMFVYLYFSIEKRVLTFISCAIGLLVLSHAIFYTGQYQENTLLLGLSKLVVLNSNYITFTFIGTTLYYTLSKQWTYVTGIVTAVLLLLLNFCCVYSGNYYEGVEPLLLINHTYVLAFFLILYALNNYIPYSNLLNLIAEISYPLYLIHGFTGFSLYFLFYHLTQNVTASCIIAFCIVITLSLVVHYCIEKPTMALSKKLIKNKISFLQIPRYLRGYVQ